MIFGAPTSVAARSQRSFTVIILAAILVSIIYFEKHIPQLQFPASPVKAFPRRLWQTSSVRSSNGDRASHNGVDSWASLNPSYRYELLTDGTSISYVQSTFSDRPDVIECFTSMTDPVARSVFVRYLALLADGGVYSGIETTALQPINAWIPKEHKPFTNLVLGLESDDYSEEEYDNTFHMESLFSTSTLMTKPNHWVMQKMVYTIVSLSSVDLVSISGSRALAEIVYAYLSFMTATHVSSANFSGITQPKRIADVLVFPAAAFQQNYSSLESPGDQNALVKHVLTSESRLLGMKDGLDTQNPNDVIMLENARVLTEEEKSFIGIASLDKGWRSKKLTMQEETAHALAEGHKALVGNEGDRAFLGVFHEDKEEQAGDLVEYALGKAKLLAAGLQWLEGRVFSEEL